MAWESSDNSRSESIPEPRPLFQQVLHCFPINRYKNPHLETCDKIILPPSSLSLILYNKIQYPLVLKLQSYNTNAISYSGVMEFNAEEGNVYLPEWMIQNLNIQEGESIVVSNASNVLKGYYMEPRSDGCGSIERFRPFTGKGQRLGGKYTVAVVVELLSEIVIEDDKKRSAKEELKKEFEPFTGKSHVLGGLLF
ncbi:PREDICTED: ubiquitin fusion degradation protein 1-like [Erythranthe guttata]|uniref:ubiquitin fusion degradation protein 1-like n=1 Tax=Erythranthe guttata TaxID=4155 RepID=UPI00064D8A0E|nr:PREDICTED: ubiquitin fusion degradation protein 1-like [Erythranthe guttata]|eukprot:XP_012837827.1 PREDICTED: ubiquitin fusion degradation protein 1-like [Erythranthe guttata]